MKSPEEIADDIEIIGGESFVHDKIAAAITAEREHAQSVYATVTGHASTLIRDLEQARRDLRIVAEYALSNAPRCVRYECGAFATRMIECYYCAGHAPHEAWELHDNDRLRLAMEAVGK